MLSRYFSFFSLVVFPTTNFDQLEFTFKLEDRYSGCWCTDLAAGQLMMQDGWKTGGKGAVRAQSNGGASGLSSDTVDYLYIVVFLYFF